MSKVKIQGNASGTGVVTLTAPNTNIDRTITLPDGDISLGVGIDDNATSTAITIDASENVTLAGTVNGLAINVSATNNLGLGTGAVDSITTGGYNVGVGDGALTNATSGARNTAIGWHSLTTNSSVPSGVVNSVNSLIFLSAIMLSF